MSRWFRHYAGMARDEKLVRVAIKSGQPLERVVWVWIAILESAAEKNHEGEFDFDADECAYFLRCDPEAISSIHDALVGQGRIGDGKISKWDVRQYKTDSSTDRVRRHREKRANAGLAAQWQPSKEFRQAIYDRDGNCCVYCSSSEDLTIDHKTPELRGGDNSEDNLQTACRQCNAAKRDLTHEEFLARNACNVSGTGQRKKTETYNSEPIGSGAAAPTAADFTKSMWDTGKAILKAAGHDDRRAGSILGRFRKTYSDSEVLTVLSRCQIEQPSEPVEWISKALQAERNKANGQPNGRPADRGPDPILDALRRATAEAAAAECAPAYPPSDLGTGYALPAQSA